MAPNLSKLQHEMSQHLYANSPFGTAVTSDLVICHQRSIQRHRSNLRYFGSTQAPKSKVGRRPAVDDMMLEALKDHLMARPDAYLDEMAVFLWDEFGVHVPLSSIQRALKRAGWSRSIARRVARERNADLRDSYAHEISGMHSWQFVFVDESGSDKRCGTRKTAWSPKGTRARQVTDLRRGLRYQILPAYTQDGVLLARVYHGTTDGKLFEDYISQLLEHCNPFPDPRSVLVMDNASIHKSARIKQLCDAAGVKLIYLPPYSPDLNPIEQWFSSLKANIKRHWHEYESDPDEDFQNFLERRVDIVGSRKDVAKAQFEFAGIQVETWQENDKACDRMD